MQQVKINRWGWWLTFLTALLWVGKVKAQSENQLTRWQINQMRAALVQYQSLAAANTWAALPEDICLKPGDTDQFVLKLRNNLCLTEDLLTFTDTHVFFFDADLTKAVKQFQQRHGLTADGIVGYQTLAALNITPVQRLRQIQVNLTRWEEEAFSFPLVFVNIPDFTLLLFDQAEQVVWETKVIVGQVVKSLQTALLNSQISYVVVHPTWNIPKSIIREEIIPVLKKDPGYLARNHMVLFRQENGRKRTLNPNQVNWKKVDLQNITIIQRAGSWNALGRIKFIFPNSYDIYLHDTPIKSLFSHPVRAYSHGCVRVQDPEGLAAFLLSADWYKQPAPSRVLEGYAPEKIIYLPKPVKIKIGYFTSWVDEAGLLQFRRDIYNRDQFSLSVLLVP